MGILVQAIANLLNPVILIGLVLIIYFTKSAKIASLFAAVFVAVWCLLPIPFSPMTGLISIVLSTALASGIAYFAKGLIANKEAK